MPADYHLMLYVAEELENIHAALDEAEHPYLRATAPTLVQATHRLRTWLNTHAPQPVVDEDLVNCCDPWTAEDAA